MPGVAGLPVSGAPAPRASGPTRWSLAVPFQQMVLVRGRGGAKSLRASCGADAPNPIGPQDCNALQIKYLGATVSPRPGAPEGVLSVPWTDVLGF